MNAFENKVPRRVSVFRYYTARLLNSPRSSAKQIGYSRQSWIKNDLNFRGNESVNEGSSI
jgi:hypothetical protein